MATLSAQLIIKFVIILFVSSWLSACGNSENETVGPLDVGDKVHELFFDNLSGGTYSTNHFQDKLIILNFWASWCGPCRKEMPSLQQLSNLLDQEKFQVIGISVDDDINLAREFLLEQNISFLNLHDRDKVHARNQFGITAYPVTFIIAPDGTINRKILGEQVWNSLGMTDLLKQIQQGNTITRGSFAFGG